MENEQENTLIEEFVDNAAPAEEAEETETLSDEVEDTEEVTDEDVPVELADEEDEDSETDEEEAEPDYTPNYTYKANNEEHEFDEWAQLAIDSPETEKAVRELYERSQGLDAVKTRLEETRTKYTEVDGKYTNVTQNLERIDGYLKDGKLGRFFSEIRVPTEAVMKWALEQAKLQQLPPEQRQVYETQDQQAMRMEQLERENQQYQQNTQTQQELQVSNEIDTILTSAEVAPIVEAFNSQAGDPNAFRNEVLNRGKLHHYETNGGSLTVRQAVDQVARLSGGYAPQAYAQQAQVAQAAPVRQTAPSARAPVIPNVGGKSSSPTREAPRSIADLKRLAAQM